ncbi:hypothetical protein TNCV_3234771 [Trichonephila clavipes]|nr:hypothetical protein TNCV_3234771 [Trichonephila clavipes]
MDKPTTSSMTDEHSSCIVCEKLSSSSENNSDLDGFCASYKEATLYEASATFATPPEIKLCSFAQFVHGNADFNINYIDGKGTFHYTGSIEIITLADSIQPRRPIKRFKTLPPESVSLLKKGISLFKCIQLL